MGPSSLFLSGISYYTHRLAVELAHDHQLRVLLLRRLLPARFYPGRVRVGRQLVAFGYPTDVEVFDGLDWFWGPEARRAARFVTGSRPDVVVLQWWTGAVLHSYLALAALARRRRAHVVLEMHEAQDVGELAVPLAGPFVQLLFPRLLRRCAALVVHSEFDRRLIVERFDVGDTPVVVIPHGPYSPMGRAEARCDEDTARPAVERSPNDPTRLLYFGVIRPFKGLEDLLTAFASLTVDQAARYELTVVGETWEGWTKPAQMIADHVHRERITFVNRYVSDDEASAFYAMTDALVLPYHRSSSSGPLQLAIGHGLPVMVTGVGGLVEAVAGYSGAVTVPPQRPDAIAAALPELRAKIGIHHHHHSSWQVTRQRYRELFDRILS